MSADHFFDGGWCWMTHPSRNIGNAIPVFMYAANGVRYYVPLDPSEGSEFVWEERDNEWEMVVPPLAASLIESAPALLQALRDLLAEVTTPQQQWVEGSAVNRARAAIAKATGSAS